MGATIIMSYRPNFHGPNLMLLTTTENTITYHNTLSWSFRNVFSFSWGHFNSQENLKTMLMQNFWVSNKECYGIFCSGQFHVVGLVGVYFMEYTFAPLRSVLAWISAVSSNRKLPREFGPVPFEAIMKRERSRKLWLANKELVPDYNCIRHRAPSPNSGAGA